MKFKHEVSSEFISTFRSEKVAGMFDVDVNKKLVNSWDVDFPIEQVNPDWQIGVIVGPSGSGKTTLSKKIFGEENYYAGYEWKGPSVVDDFPAELSAKDITAALSAVGFASPPEWLKPFHVLSNGQKFRAELARLLTEDRKLVVFDEFTSVVDRTVAQIGSSALAKFIRRTDKKFVAVGCHYDILDWIDPDWIYYVDTNVFEYLTSRGSERRVRPEIEIRVRRVHYSAWRLFEGHHYLDQTINKSAHCYVAQIGDKPVAFTAALKFPHDKVKDMWKEHRTVVLPDYQGLGIGKMMSALIAEHYHSQGLRYTSVTSHPAFVFSRMRDPRWVMTRAPGRVPTAGKSSKVTGQSASRMTAAFEYIGNKGKSK